MLPRFHPLARLALCLVGVALSLAIVGLTISGAIATTARWTNRPPAAELQAFFASDTNKLVSTLLVYPFILLCLIFCRRILDRRSLVSLGFRPGRAWREAGAGILCGALAISFLFGVLWLSGAVAIGGPSPEAFEAGALTSLAIALALALTFGCIGLMEEFAFRGYALHNLNAWLGWRGAVVLQAIAFAAIHPLNQLKPGASLAGLFWDARWALINIALIAVFFAQCYRKSGALWFPIGFHAAWNFFLGVVWSLPVSGLGTFHLLDVTAENSVWSGGTFGAEASPLLTPILAALIYIVHRQPDHAQAILDLNLLSPNYVAPVETVAPFQTMPLGANSPEADSEAIEEAERVPNRFKTSMRPTSETPQLDPKIFETTPPTFSAPAIPAALSSAEFAAPGLATNVVSANAEPTDIGALIAARTGATNAPVAAPDATPEPQIIAPPQATQPAGAPKSTPESAPEIPQSATTSNATAPQSPTAQPPTAQPPSGDTPAAQPSTPKPKPKAPRW